MGWKKVHATRMTPWEEWKKKNAEKQRQGIVSPAAFFNPETVYADKDLEDQRLAICKDCEHYLVTTQCSQCGCFMPAKVKLLYSSCPKGLW